MKVDNSRVDWIDFGKGFTILLVFLGHLFLGLYQSGRFESTNFWLLFVTQLVYIFHIPTFFALSGYFFKPLQDLKTYGFFLLNKTIALGVPYVFYSALHIFLQKIAGSSVREMSQWSDLLYLYKQPIAVGWYLFTLWWMFMIFGFISIWVKKSSQLLAIGALFFLLALVSPVDNYTIQKFLLWSLPFILGAYLKQSGLMLDDSLSKKCRLICAVITPVYLLIWSQMNFELYTSYLVPGWWGLIFIVSIFLAFSTFPHLTGKLVTYFKTIGQDSLGVYLFHAPILSMLRIILLRLGVTSVAIHILGGIVLGWTITLVAVYIAKKIVLVDVLLYPLKYIKIKK